MKSGFRVQGSGFRDVIVLVDLLVHVRVAVVDRPVHGRLRMAVPRVLSEGRWSAALNLSGL